MYKYWSTCVLRRITPALSLIWRGSIVVLQAVKVKELFHKTSLTLNARFTLHCCSSETCTLLAVLSSKGASTTLQCWQIKSEIDPVWLWCGLVYNDRVRFTHLRLGLSWRLVNPPPPPPPSSTPTLHLSFHPLPPSPLPVML